MEVPQSLHEVFSSPLTDKGFLKRRHEGGGVADGGLSNGVGGAELLAEWHARWACVLEVACARHGVSDAARAEVTKLPLVGWYPAMRLVVDALCGRWAAVAAATLSRTGFVVWGWPSEAASRLRTTAAALHPCMRAPHREALAGPATSLLLSQTTASGAVYRPLLRVDTDASDLVPAGAGKDQPAVGFTALLLTGYAATRAEVGTSATPADTGTTDSAAVSVLVGG